MTEFEALEDDGVRARQPQPDHDAPRSDPAERPLVSTLGNASVQRLLRSAETDEDHPAVDDDVSLAIESKRGGGRALDEHAQRNLGGALGADFGDVRVHDDTEADSLNRAVKADAFTTGSDIFFREGQYQPGTSDGDRLLAHELTHVVQQREMPASSGETTVSHPDDPAEREASSVGDQVGVAGGAAQVSRQEDEEEELMMSPHLDRQDEEEEELMMAPHLDRQGEEEEEELQMSPHLDRQDEEEEEDLMMSLQRSPHDGPRGATGA